MNPLAFLYFHSDVRVVQVSTLDFFERFVECKGEDTDCMDCSTYMDKSRVCWPLNNSIKVLMHVKILFSRSSSTFQFACHILHTHLSVPIGWWSMRNSPFLISQ